jgi:hypothetical protein
MEHPSTESSQLPQKTAENELPFRPTESESLRLKSRKFHLKNKWTIKSLIFDN